ncbi:MAG: hypothetical protein KJN79_00600 [Gammaproteobacteria bacterium]|nr:hypothetical protein [Gammaproteobacteria bacterium]
MDEQKKPLSADELAAQAAESMFKGGRHGSADQPRTLNHQRSAQDDLEKGGAGGMPTSTAAATGGFTSTAGGKVLDKGEDEEDEKMSYKADDDKDMEYKGQKGVCKGDDEDEDEDGDEDDNDMEKMGTKKSEDIVDADALMKSMDVLEAAADGYEAPEPDRRSELAKSLEAGTLTDDERAELMGLLGAEDPAPASDAISKSWQSDQSDADEPMDKGFSDVFSEEFSEDYDVSPFLEKFGHTVGASLDIMREDLTKSAGDQQRFNRALAQSFRGMATLVKSQQEMIKGLSDDNAALGERLGVVEHRPVGRKSIARPAQARALQKSFAGQEPEDGMDKGQIYKGLHLLMQKYKDNGGRARNGEPVDRAVAALESGAQAISKSMMDEVREVLGK